MIQHNLQRMNVQDDEREKATWKYEHSFDYHYGRTMGMLILITRSEFEKFYGKPATDPEVMDIIAFLDTNSIKIRQALAYLKR